ncbi:ERF family protein [Alcaligenes faecalis]|uniref:ERF family protein n=1 Tax=Alcaligenes faecalis TaxID=511 RepID=UPI001C82D7B1|nr:ERF family protein [Alcaligenes faecalis]MBX6966033.1 single-stranded DNA-binding protein [Providencia rettgeri]MBX7031164.1 single-stranded DNA-binding protein [Alcaligenes faecalis]
MSTEIIEKPQAAVAAPAPAGSPMAMAIAALQSGMSPEQIGQMMDLQDRYNATQAKKAYDEAFAAFKAESVTIIKGKARSDGPLKNQKYAELHDVVNAVTPALSKHGLSSSWKLTKDDKDWMEVTCYLRHVGGHQESVSMGGPPDAGPGRNAIQSRASTKTYLERYTLKAITGLSEQDDDTDGRVPIDTSIVDDWVAAAEGASSMEELDKTWKDGLKELTKTDSLQVYDRFKTAVSAAKKRLEKNP